MWDEDERKHLVEKKITKQVNKFVFQNEVADSKFK